MGPQVLFRLAQEDLISFPYIREKSLVQRFRWVYGMSGMYIAPLCHVLNGSGQLREVALVSGGQKAEGVDGNEKS